MEIRDEDRPSQTPRIIVELLGRASRAGRSIGDVAERIHQAEGEPGVTRSGLRRVLLPAPGP